ncbi:hypothetical protein FOXG_21975 [Fusarium oxysporum f. sp. lycopersici 4287]|uniref:Uncharacterized protein n=1 Tax=Fusarium oxysporum f. sp. lycopersici (strain 4287 / CBS 123668 / FGSC 9935 / NRRL 34936) TaxID=426428 RepID=A0A0J9W421_FUSO4|nr:hypothetical protein FOXG_21975 [Fusarium oxysporum f. sp. lycopersici 4287]KNB17581.1 hypothetical protein FOXG_21975 [Fusarium oxysporum f. sp. lycopersici 4287]
MIKVKFSKDESSGFQAPWKSLVIILPFGDHGEPGNTCTNFAPDKAQLTYCIVMIQDKDGRCPD